MAKNPRSKRLQTRFATFSSPLMLLIVIALLAPEVYGRLESASGLSSTPSPASEVPPVVVSTPSATPGPGMNMIHIQVDISGVYVEEGATCHPFGDKEFGLYRDSEDNPFERDNIVPWPQVLITDDGGRVVGVMDLYEGIGRDRAFCFFDSWVVVSDSPFYTIAVDGMYSYTISRESLAGNRWEHYIRIWLED